MLIHFFKRSLTLQMCNGGHTISTDTCSVCCNTNVCNNQVPADCHAIIVPTHDPVTTLTAITNAPIVTNAPHTSFPVIDTHSSICYKSFFIKMGVMS